MLGGCDVGINNVVFKSLRKIIELSSYNDCHDDNSPSNLVTRSLLWHMAFIWPLADIFQSCVLPVLTPRMAGPLTLLERTKKQLRSVLLSEKNGVAAERLERDYRDLVD